MLFSSIALFAASAAAWTVPADQPNGTYSCFTDSAGISSHTLLRAFNSSSTDTTTELVSRSAKFHHKRDNIGENNIGCAGYALSNSDNGAAAGELEAQCGNGAFVGKGLDFYSIVGNSVVYYCNLASESNQCYSSEAVDAFARITSECGLNTAGWDNVPQRSDQYGYEAKGSNFCGRGT